jgi:hypothetical protein
MGQFQKAIFLLTVEKTLCHKIKLKTSSSERTTEIQIFEDKRRSTFPKTPFSLLKQNRSPVL